MNQQQSSASAIDNPLDQEGLCLLSLDGGGVRGLSTLMILRSLMNRINSERKDRGQSPVKPCELFDLIGGTSTGGLIAILLGRLQLDVDECIAAYTSIFEDVFKKPKHSFPIDFKGSVQGRFNSKALRKAMNGIVGSKGISPTQALKLDETRPCRTFVCATAYENARSIHLRDYELHDESNYDQASIVDAALATSAATTFFEPVTIGARRYVDGGLGANNPVDHVWNEAQSIWCPEDGKLEPLIKCFVSIGTGNPGSKPIKEKLISFLTKTLADIATETESTATTFAARNRGLLDAKRYFRYNVAQGLQDVGLDEYRKQAEIETVTVAYLADQEQKFKVRDCARILHVKESPTPLRFARDISAYQINLDARPSQSPPTTHFIVPFSSCEELCGREGVLSQLDEMMCIPSKHNRVALAGLGGIGKTRIALEFALRLKTSKTISVFWVHAGNAARMERAYGDIAKIVSIPGWNLDSNVDKLQLVKTWFEDEKTPTWILIIDNADDVDLLYGTNVSHDDRSSSRLADYFPHSANGSILLTTRNKKVAHKFTAARSVLKVEALSLIESNSLLAARLGDDSPNRRHYTELAEVLERLPLALVQAAAFILEQSSSVADYLKLYNNSDASRTQLLSDEFEDDVRDSNMSNLIITTFAISFRQIKKQDPRAADLLSTMSMFDAQAIPQSLITFDEDPVLFTKALGTLKGYSLIALRNDTMSQSEHCDPQFDLHRLVRLAMRRWLDLKNELDVWRASTIVALSERLPLYVHTPRFIWATYLSHILVLLSSEKTQLQQNYELDATVTPYEVDLSKEGAAEAELCYKVSTYANSKGHFRLGESMAKRSLELNLMICGREHPNALNCIDILARMLCDRGEYDKAEKLHREVLEGRETALGKEHPDTLKSLDNLAGTFSEQEKLQAAKRLLRQALEVRGRFLGADHPDTVLSLNILAHVLTLEGKYHAAEGTLQLALERSERVLGKKHPNTMMSVLNLAITVGDLRKYEVAEKMLRESLPLVESVFGKDHPIRLTSHEKMAYILARQGQYQKAEQIYRINLEKYSELMGTEHPYTMSQLVGLAKALTSQGKYEEAEALQRQGLEIVERLLGDKQLLRLEILSGLAKTLDLQGKLIWAERFYRQALCRCERALPKDHRATIWIYHSLANLLSQQKRYAEARVFYKQAYTGYVKGFGGDHPCTQKTLKNYRDMMEEVKQVYEEASNKANGHRRSRRFTNTILVCARRASPRTARQQSWKRGTQSTHSSGTSRPQSPKGQNQHSFEEDDSSLDHYPVRSGRVLTLSP